MLDIHFGIPSYRRPQEVLTLDLLESAGIPSDRITISTQTKEDWEAYTEKHGDRAHIIYHPGECVADNRNTLLDHFPAGTRLVIMDDDVKAIAMLDRAGKRTETLPANILPELIAGSYGRAAVNGALTWGVYPVDNAYFMSRKTDSRAILIGTLLGITTRKEYRFDPEYYIKDDYDYCLQQIAHGRPVMRINYLVCRAKHKSKGGNIDNLTTDKLKADYERITSRYPALVKGNTKREYEILLRRKNR
jgi:hypothetical protein